MASRSSQLGYVGALLLASGLFATGCSKPEAQVCSTGIYCPAGSQCAARQAVCIWDNCGNGNLDAGEACDDGNTLGGDGCSASCKSSEVCGNDVTDREVGEVCDDGNTESGDGCSGDCRSIEACGNGAPDPGEDCDGGEGAVAHQAKETPICTPYCKWSVCGDGYTNGSADEDCDGGDPVAPGRRETAECNADCTRSECGDGKTNETDDEQCDDGARNGENARCLPTCRLNVCGDGFRDATREQCDDGPTNADGGTDFSGACLPGCVRARCGDGNVQAGVEDCDAGPDSALDAHACPYGLTSCRVCNRCRTVTESTRLTGYCGDGTPNGPEACDEGRNNGNTVCPYSAGGRCEICNSTCSGRNPATGPRCGDGRPDAPDEVCDQGDGINGTTYCDGGTNCGRICNGSCKGWNTNPEYCGDGTPQAGEVCDQGARNGTATCLYSEGGTCRICNATCSGTAAGTGPRCGDGRTDPGETCDQGDAVNGTTYCAGGTSCGRICGRSCTSWNDRPGYCGDGEKQDEESCDEGSNLSRANHNGSTTCDYGVRSCVHCNTSCTARDVAGTGPYCGDGQKTSPEQCDDSQISGSTIVDYNGTGYCPRGAQCHFVCNATCTWWDGSYSTWQGYCGDGTVNASVPGAEEQCDSAVSVQCGTCSDGNAATPCQVIPAAPAIGNIEIRSLERLAGVTITLQAGGAGNPTRNYLFVSDSTDTTAGHVDISSMTSTSQAATALAAAVNAETGFAIKASASGAIVGLTNSNGKSGNTPVLATSPSGDLSAVVLAPLSGGNGCMLNDVCRYSSDCVSGRCSGSRCEAPR